jgi:hypothetical protein
MLRSWFASLASVTLSICLLTFSSTGFAQQPQAIPPEPIQRLGTGSQGPCPSIEEARRQFKRLTEIDLSLYAQDRQLPPDCSEEIFGGTQSAGRMTNSLNVVNWAPTNLFHQPLYFDDVPLEQYGQSICPHLQPVISGARFFLTVPAMPYKIGVDHPFDCVTTLGYYRPGNCAPCMKEVLPIEGDAALLQAATTVALVFLLP